MDGESSETTTDFNAKSTSSEPLIGAHKFQERTNRRQHTLADVVTEGLELLWWEKAEILPFLPIEIGLQQPHQTTPSAFSYDKECINRACKEVDFFKKMCMGGMLHLWMALRRQLCCTLHVNDIRILTDGDKAVEESKRKNDLDVSRHRSTLQCAVYCKAWVKEDSMRSPTRGIFAGPKKTPRICGYALRMTRFLAV
ncbi:hypothetical protein PILCRDRAFT_541300 [Piloderma croceum F 1598]|uniref:Uncharacterized protein n=1 Tax=Piloderma croceum (strain F 1598) TaxID=765440 RepID=A0A0C3FKA3_PILCF|nr:hypothetical protein PILCRDRAFT_541300 [Piloderma croceum F 1598]